MEMGIVVKIHVPIQGKGVMELGKKARGIIFGREGKLGGKN